MLLPTDFDEYRRYSRLFKAAVRRASRRVIEDRGIDEIYIDLSDHPGAQADHGRAVGQARSRRGVQAATGLSCSIGITPNKLLSKMCLRARQARRPDDAARGRDPDPHLAAAGAPINGIGPKAARSSRPSCGIHTIGELAAADPA